MRKSRQHHGPVLAVTDASHEPARPPVTLAGTVSQPRPGWERDDDWRFAAVHLSARAARLHEELRAIEAEALRIAESVALENRLEAHLQDQPISSEGLHRLRSCDITAL